MKKIILSLLTSVLLVFPFMLSAERLDICYDPLCTTGLIQNRTGLGNVEPVIVVSRLINYAFTFLGILSLVLCLYAGYSWMTGRGNEERVQKAKDILQGAIIGLIILLASYSIASFVFNNLANITNAY